MQKLYIIKLGSTFPNIAKQFGDFEVWIEKALGPLRTGIEVVNIENGDALPSAKNCAGVIITGSHAMVTENQPWSIKLEKWIPTLLVEQMPLFCICYGHQILARATGGRVGFHPGGMEIGTTEIKRLPDTDDDPLFKNLPKSFKAHVLHAQTVLQLPPAAKCLAENPFEPHHAVRIGNQAWGIQFHPEFNADIMRAYILSIDEAAESEEVSAKDPLHAITDTPEASDLLRLFGSIVDNGAAFE